MNRPSSRLLIVLLAGIAVVVLGAIVTVVVIASSGNVEENLRLAESHTLLLREEIADDPRFEQVEFIPTTSHGGSIHIYGNVPTDHARARLVEIVEASEPTRPVFWFVTVESANGD